MQYYFAANGEYLGGYNDAAISSGQVPSGAVKADGPHDGRDKLINGVVVPYIETSSLNERLATAFNQLLPNHIGKPYLTPEVTLAIGNCNLAVTKFNELDSTGALGKAALQGLAIPPEMNADKNYLLSLFN